ncbi:MAG: hypothetical protein NT084_10530 [Bacteroidetes bacterium]|nr:hypothetical protein [Bacteroidota bacterium]
MNNPSHLFRNLALVAAIFCSQIAFSQAGAKWATGGNSVGTGDFFGTTNNYSLLFKVNNVQKMSLNTTGTLQLNSLAGTGTGFVTLDANGNLIRTTFPIDPNKYLNASGTFTPVTVAGAWSFNGNNMYNPNSGFVGIGTSSPQYLLDVNGNARVNGTLYALGLVLATKMQADTMKSTSMISINNNLRFYSGMVNDIYTTTGEVRLQSRLGYSGNTILNAGNNGNVGVGIYAPQYKFDVNGDARVSGKILVHRIIPLAGDSEIHFGDSSLVFSTNQNNIRGSSTAPYKGLGLGYGAYAFGLNSTAVGYNVKTGGGAQNSVIIGSGSGNFINFYNAIPNSLMVGFNSNIPTLFIGPSSGVNTTGNV